MKLKNAITDPLWRIFFTSFFVVMGLAAFEIGRRLVGLGVFFSLGTFWWPAVICILVFSLIGIFFVQTSRFPKIVSRLVIFTREQRQNNSINSIVVWCVFSLIALFFPAWVMFRGYIVLNGYFVRIFLFGMVCILGMIFLKPHMPDVSWPMALEVVVLVAAAIYRTMVFIPDISGSPFSLGWSEGSRYYYGSLFFSERLYGQDLPLSILHPSRYMLLSLPFVFSGLPIWFHRLWQVMLWIGLAGWTGYLLAKRMNIKNKIYLATFSTWVFLYLHLGPVYYHLLICVIIIFWGANFDKPVKTFVILLIASIWAGLSRINWIPVPLFLVLALYFLERRWQKSNLLWKYLFQPFIWGTGIIIAFLSYTVYIKLSGNVTNKFSSSFTSDLLWNRLWPNSTYPLGILPGTLLVSIPLWIILYYRLKGNSNLLHPIKKLGFAIMLISLFLGGLVVSVKIGGGSNLHNMDAYFVLLLTLSAYLYWHKEVGDRDKSILTYSVSMPRWVTAMAIVIPVFLTLTAGGVATLPDPNRDEVDLRTLQRIVSDEFEAGGEILFISERQLQVFGLMPEIPLVAEYEKIELMEMAMSGNDVYMDGFYENISNKRYSMIVTDSSRMDKKDETEAFSEEHNIWVEKVILPLVRNYKFYPLGERRNIVIMSPR